MVEDKTQLLQGTLDLLVLKALARGPLHGYGIGRRIRQLSEDALRVEEGSLYPALHRLERRAWLASEWGLSEHNQRAKYYRLTRAGRKQLATEEETWQRLSAAVNQVLGAC